MAKTIKFVQLASFILVAVAMAGGWAHLLELATKMQLSRPDYLVVQQIYRGWSLLGIASIGGLLSTALLGWMQRGKGAPCFHAWLASACLLLALIVFFLFTFPANQTTANWTVLPENWEALRRQWEYSHAAGAVLYMMALIALALSVITER